MMLMLVTSLLIVIARESPHCDALNLLERGFFTRGMLKSTVDSFSKSIKDAGLDPLRGISQTFNNTKIIPVNITVSEFSSDGLSNIVLNKADFNIVSSSLDYEIEMPSVNMTLGNTLISANVIDNPYTMVTSVKIELTKIRFTGKIKFALEITSGIKVEEFIIHSSLRDLQPNVKLIIQGDDYSEIMNIILGMIPVLIKENSDLIDAALAKLFKNYVTQLLNSLF